MAAVKKHLCGFLCDDRGATAIEYGLITSLIVVVIIGALQTLGATVLTQLFNKVAAAM